MDSVPYEFIERTILLASPIRRFSQIPFRFLSGHWGRYAKLLDEETELYKLTVDIHNLTDIYCRVSGRNCSLEHLLQLKHTFLYSLKVHCYPEPHADAEKMDEQKVDVLKRLLRRSNGLTTMELYVWPMDTPLVNDLLEAVPLVEFVFLSHAVEEGPGVLSFVEKHLQRRRLRRLQCFGSIPRGLHPVVQAFLKESEFLLFEMQFGYLEEDFAKEIIRLIAENLKKRRTRIQEVHVHANKILTAKLKKAMGKAIQGRSSWKRWFGRFVNMEGGRQGKLEMKVTPYMTTDFITVLVGTELECYNSA